MSYAPIFCIHEVAVDRKKNSEERTAPNDDTVGRHLHV